MPLELETRMHMGFRLMRVIDARLVAGDCRLDLTINITMGQKSAKDRLKAMRLWIEQFLDGSIAIPAGRDLDTTTFEELTNFVLLCPDEPHDYLLLLLIHSKLNAIGAGEVVIETSSMVTDTGEGFSNSISGTTEDWLPSMQEWMGPRSYHDRPWWERDDSSTLDMMAEEGDDLSQTPNLGVNLLALISQEYKPDEPAPVAEIIKPKFKPRLVSLDDAD